MVVRRVKGEKERKGKRALQMDNVEGALSCKDFVHDFQFRAWNGRA